VFLQRPAKEHEPDQQLAARRVPIHQELGPIRVEDLVVEHELAFLIMLAIAPHQLEAVGFRLLEIEPAMSSCRLPAARHEVVRPLTLLDGRRLHVAHVHRVMMRAAVPGNAPPRADDRRRYSGDERDRRNRIRDEPPEEAPRSVPGESDPRKGEEDVEEIYEPNASLAVDRSVRRQEHPEHEGIRRDADQQESHPGASLRHRQLALSAGSTCASHVTR
jgi:hypothetical protein